MQKASAKTKKKKLNPRASVREFTQIPQSDFTFTSAAASTSQVSSRTVPVNSERPLKRQRTENAPALLSDTAIPNPIQNEDPAPQAQKQVGIFLYSFCIWP